MPRPVIWWTTAEGRGGGSGDCKEGGAKGRGERRERGGRSVEWGSLKSGREVYPLGMPGAKSLCFKVVKTKAREKATGLSVSRD